jgi:hypothetical protein
MTGRVQERLEREAARAASRARRGTAAPARPPAGPVEGLLGLQRLAGNRAVARLVAGGPPVVQRKCADGAWTFQYDGCSVPAAAVAVGRGQRGAYDKDNPAGGRDTHFAKTTSTLSGGVACDRHDECYQSCGSDRANCDARMYQDMREICQRSTENAQVKSECMRWAAIYHKALRVGGEGAHQGRQEQVCACDPKTSGPALRYPPRDLLTRKSGAGHGRHLGWLDYQIMRGFPPLSAYMPFPDEEAYRRYLRGAAMTPAAGPGQGGFLEMRNPRPLGAGR